MKHPILLAACVLALVALVALVPCAADGPPARTKGKVLILLNDRAMDGDVERVADGYIVRHDGELWLPANKVKCLCRDWEEALAVMRSQANLDDPDERTRLAKWCEQNGLFTAAIDEAKRALQMRPKHVATQQYLFYLQHAAEMAARPIVPAPSHKDLDSAPALDLSADTLSLFVTKVQPVLMNTCAQCHANSQGGHFQLTRVSGIGAGWQRATQLNMAAAVRQINLDRSDLSPLLIKAVSPHGRATKAPLAGHSAPPFLILKEWVETTIANNPHLRQELSQSGAAGGQKSFFTAGDGGAPAAFATQANAPGGTKTTDAPAVGAAVPGVASAQPFSEPGKLPKLAPLPPTMPGQAGAKVGNPPAGMGKQPTVLPAVYVPTAVPGTPVSGTAAEPPIPRDLTPGARPTASSAHPANDPFDPNGFNNLFFRGKS